MWLPARFPMELDFSAVKDITSAKPAQQDLRSFISLFTLACWVL